MWQILHLHDLDGSSQPMHGPYKDYFYINHNPKIISTRTLRFFEALCRAYESPKKLYKYISLYSFENHRLRQWNPSMLCQLLNYSHILHIGEWLPLQGLHHGMEPIHGHENWKKILRITPLVYGGKRMEIMPFTHL